MPEPLREGMVVKSTGSWYEVLAEGGQERFRGRLRGKFKLKGLKVTNPLAVGDRVAFKMEDERENTVLITDILDRENCLVRKSTHKTAHGHILAANLDQALLLATLALPRTSLGFIDRFLVSAESYRIPAAVLFNKADLLTEEGLEVLAEFQELYESLGYRTLALSAQEDDSFPEVEALLAGKRSLLAGHSGVGKSTLLNRLAPHVEQRVSEVSSFANKGVHTTTFAEMFEVRPGAFLIDTPGIKELGVMDIKAGELSHYFPEMRERAEGCKFYNCTHTHEPSCAVIEAVEEGRIAPSRYHSYLSILEDSDNRR